MATSKKGNDRQLVDLLRALSRCWPSSSGGSDLFAPGPIVMLVPNLNRPWIGSPLPGNCSSPSSESCVLFDPMLVLYGLELCCRPVFGTVVPSARHFAELRAGESGR